MIAFSIKNKMTVAVSLLVAAVLAMTGVFAFQHFKEKLRETISRQQFILVSAMARELDGKIRTMQEHLQAMVHMMEPEIHAGIDRADSVLESQLDNQMMFDRGIFLFAPNGKLLSATVQNEFYLCNGECPLETFAARTAESRSPQISEPFFLPRENSRPAILFTVPIFDPNNEIAAVLGGSLDLLGDNFLGSLAEINLGKAGYLSLYSQERSVIVHPDRSRVPRKIAAGINPLFDRALAGFEGTGETVTAWGLEAFSSYKRLHTTNWLLAANYPVAEVFEPIEEARRSFLIGSAMMLVLASSLAWLLMHHLTAPLLRLARNVRTMEEPVPLTSFQVGTRDEIGVLAQAFNQVLGKISFHQRAMGEQVHFLQVLINAIPSPVFFKDAAGRYLGCNRAFEGFIGIAGQDLVGKSVYEIAPPDLADIYFQADAELFAKGIDQEQIYESTVLYADGTRHDVIFYKATFPTSEGKLGGLIGVILDITERKQAEKALAEQKKFSENLLENAAVACFVVDAEHRVLAWNRACEKLTGIAAADLIGTQDHWRAFYPQPRPCLADFILDGDATKLTAHYDNCRPSALVPEGWLAEGWISLHGWRYLVANAAPIRNGQGEVIAAIETLEDLTRQHQALHQLGKLSLAVEQSPNIVVITDAAGTIEYVNPRFTEVTGYASKEAIGQNPRILKGGDSPDEYYRTLWETITAGKKWQGEFHNRKKNGELFWENALVSPLTNVDGAITHFVAIKEDITGKKHAERHHQLTSQVLALLALPNEKTDKIRDIIRLIGDFTGFEAVAIRLKQNGDFPFYLARGFSGEFLAKEDLIRSQMHEGKRGKFASCLCGKILLGETEFFSPFFTGGGSFWTSGEASLCEPVMKDLCARSRCFREGFNSLALIPLRSGDDVIGLLHLGDQRAGLLTHDLVCFLENLAGSIGIAIEQHQAAEKLLDREDRLHFLTNHDPLTGLPNRSLLHDRLQHALAKNRRTGKKVALLFLDLDRFKTINDSLGYEIGDRMLCEMAERLKSLVREVDTMARLSGDEFAVLLEDLDDLKKVAQIAQKVLGHLSQVIRLDDYQLHVTTSIGISLFPSDADDADSLLKYAEIAMYRSKELGRNNYQFYLPEMNVRTRELLLLENSLRQALDRAEFTLFFQPKIDLTIGRMIGVEILLRWRHPELGHVSPAEFIPLAEETGLIVPIGEWVLKAACTWARSVEEKQGYSLNIAVNISGRQFKQSGFVDTVGRVLRETGLPPDCLELEITESVLLDRVEETARTLSALKKMGVRLAIDDFGTGYSSLNYLKRFEIDCLKIDRGFIREAPQSANDQAIVASVIALSRAMKLTVVAEGVETAEQLAFLRSLQCGQAQGYLFSRPVPHEEFLPLLGRTDWLTDMVEEQ